MMASSVIRTQLSDSQMDALREMPSVRDSTVTMSATLPASYYISPERFEFEKDAIFFAEPMLVGPSAYLPTPKSVFTQEILGVPVLLTRNAAGSVHAFLNVCRHRGTILCPKDGAQQAPRLICPYHAWSYGLDGQLLTVPRQDVFEGFQKEDHSLINLPVREAGGLIYVGLRPDADIDFSIVDGDLAEDLDGLGMGAMQIYRKTTYAVQANWKLLMDTMLDKYHVQRLHQDTLAKYFDDGPELSHMIGPHVRSTSGRINFTPDDIHPDFEVVRRRSVFGYGLYPQGAIVVSPRYVSLCVMRPIAADRTDVDYIMLITDPPQDENARSKFEQSWELMDIGFGKEDFWAAELGHKGLRTGAVPEMLMGGMEHRIKMFHDAIATRLASRRVDATA